MRRLETVCHLVLVTILVASSSFVLADDVRTAWQYEAKNGMRTMVSASHGRWIEYSAIGQSDVLIETERTEKYVELRRAKDEPDKAVKYRLFAEAGQLRKPEVGEFRQFAKGKWLPADGFDLASVDKLGPDDHRVRVVYFVPKDRKPIPKFEERIAVVMAYVSEFFRQDLREKGFKNEMAKRNAIV